MCVCGCMCMFANYSFNPRSLLEKIVTRSLETAIEYELKGSGSEVVYRSMWQRLVTDHGLAVCKDIVRYALRILDPDGVDRRLRRRLQRRQYKGRGANFIWHIDGYDKLKPFGFSIHGCIDGYSRRIMWLEVGTSNNDPTVIARYFIDCITEVGGHCPYRTSRLWYRKLPCCWHSAFPSKQFRQLLCSREKFHVWPFCI